MKKEKFRNNLKILDMKKSTLLFLLIYMISATYAQNRADRYWSGNSGSSDNIDQGNNWHDGVNPSSGDNLYFNNTLSRHWAYSNYATGSYFGNIITYSGAGGIKLYGDNIYAYKFENNNDPSLLELSPSSAGEGSKEIGNRVGSDLEINPVGDGGILVSCDRISIDNSGGAKSLKIYGDKNLTIEGYIHEKNGSGAIVEVFGNSYVTIKGNSTHTGSTTLNAGTLELQGSLSTSAVTVKSGATLKINGDAVTVASLTVESGGNVEIVAGKSLTVSGALSNNGTFTIKSGASSTGSLIVNGTTTGNITAERYIAGADWAAGDDGWHFLSSPVASQAIQPNFVSNTPATTEDFYSWDEVNNEWMNAKDGDGNWNSGFDANFVVAKGYLVAYDNDATKEFIGTPNTGNQVTPSLTASNGKYNLIGNPFSSAIAWNDGNWTLGNVGGTAQIWNSNAKDYVSLLANNIVPAMNGFMVYTTSSQTLTIPVASQTHSATAWHKNSNESEIILTAHDPNNNSYKQAIVGERSDASEGFDLAYDAYVLEGFAPKFYSINDNQQFTVNMFSELADGLTIPFGFAKNEGTEYYIKLEQTITDRTIVLTDLIANKTHNLSENPTYSFTASSTDSPDRFLLHFGVVGIGEQDQATTLHAYAYNNRLYVNNSLEQAQIAVYDLQGRLLMQQSANTSGLQSLPLDLPAGVYVVRLSNAQEAKSLKINVQ